MIFGSSRGNEGHMARSGATNGTDAGAATSPKSDWLGDFFKPFALMVGAPIPGDSAPSVAPSATPATAPTAARRTHAGPMPETVPLQSRPSTPAPPRERSYTTPGTETPVQRLPAVASKPNLPAVATSLAAPAYPQPGQGDPHPEAVAVMYLRYRVKDSRWEKYLLDKLPGMLKRDAVVKAEVENLGFDGQSGLLRMSVWFRQPVQVRTRAVTAFGKALAKLGQDLPASAFSTSRVVLNRDPAQQSAVQPPRSFAYGPPPGSAPLETAPAERKSPAELRTSAR